MTTTMVTTVITMVMLMMLMMKGTSYDFLLLVIPLSFLSEMQPRPYIQEETHVKNSRDGRPCL
jgi:hypothetical protein